jgi:hypothetical protein
MQDPAKESSASTEGVHTGLQQEHIRSRAQQPLRVSSLPQASSRAPDHSSDPDEVHAAAYTRSAGAAPASYSRRKRQRQQGAREWATHLKDVLLCIACLAIILCSFIYAYSHGALGACNAGGQPQQGSDLAATTAAAPALAQPPPQPPPQRILIRSEYGTTEYNLPAGYNAKRVVFTERAVSPGWLRAHNKPMSVVIEWYQNGDDKAAAPASGRSSLPIPPLPESEDTIDSPIYPLYRGWS